MASRLLFLVALYLALCTAVAAQGGPLTGTVQLASSVPITTWSVSGGNITFNCATDCGLSTGQSFTLSNSSSNSCNGQFYTISGVNPTSVVAPANTCTGTGTGGVFSEVGPAATLCNAASSCGSNFVQLNMDPDGTLFLQAFANGMVMSGLTLDTTPRASLYVAGNNSGGFATDENGQTCVATGAPSNPTHQCGDPHVTAWDPNGYITRFRGSPVCNQNSSCNAFPLAFFNSSGGTLSDNLPNYTLYTTLPGSGANDTTTVGAAGLYELVYYTEAQSTSPGNTMVVSLTCTDNLGTPRTLSSAASALANPGDISSGVLVCYAQANTQIQVSFTNSSAPPTYFTKGSLWEK